MGTYDALYEGQEGGRTGEPTYCDATEHRVSPQSVDRRMVSPSKMFTVKLELNTYLERNPGADVFDASQGDGGLSLGGIPPAELAEALVRYLPATNATRYGNPVGREDVRTAIFENYYRFGSDTGLTPDHIVIGDGGRDMLQKWYQVVVHETGTIGANLVVSAAPWTSYIHGPYVNSMNVLRAPGDAANGFRITAEGIDACIERSKANGREVAGLVLTSPDNPTGNYTPVADLISLVEHAAACGVRHVLVDLVYQAVTDPDVGIYDLDAFYRALSPEARARVCFMDALTKSAGASNLRNAHIVTGSLDYATRFKGMATHTVLPNAVGEAAALEVYGHSDPLQHPWVQKVVGPTAESRKLVRERFAALGYRFIADQGYYAFVNIWPWLGKRLPEPITDAAGRQIERVESVEVLKSYLTTQCGLAVIHGSVFKQPHFIRFSYANAAEYTARAIGRLNEGLTALGN